MAGSVVQRRMVELSPGNTGATTSMSVTAGNTIVVIASCYNTTGTATLTASDGSNTYTTHQNAQNSTTSMHVATAPIGSTASITVTVTISGSSGDRYLSAAVMEVTGTLSAAYDVSASSAGNSSTASTGTTAAKAQDAAFVMIGITAESSSFISAVTGFTTEYLQASAATFQPLYVGHKSVNAAGTETASDTLGGSGPWAATIVVLKEGAGGGSPAVPDNLVTMQPMRPAVKR